MEFRERVRGTFRGLGERRRLVQVPLLEPDAAKGVFAPYLDLEDLCNERQFKYRHCKWLRSSLRTVAQAGLSALHRAWDKAGGDLAESNWGSWEKLYLGLAYFSKSPLHVHVNFATSSEPPVGYLDLVREVQNETLLNLQDLKRSWDKFVEERRGGHNSHLTKFVQVPRFEGYARSTMDWDRAMKVHEGLSSYVAQTSNLVSGFAAERKALFTVETAIDALMYLRAHAREEDGLQEELMRGVIHSGYICSQEFIARHSVSHLDRALDNLGASDEREWNRQYWYRVADLYIDLYRH